MTHSSENRLTFYTLAQIKAMQEKAGVTPVVAGAPTSYTGANLQAPPPPLINRGTDLSPRGTTSTYTPTLAKPFGSVEDGEAAAQDEYIRTGSTSQETQARLDVTRDPSLLTKVGPTDYTVRGRDLTTPKVGKSVRSQTIAKGGTKAGITKRKAFTATDLKSAVDKRKKTRLANRGVDESLFNSVNDILKVGGRIIGTNDGGVTFLMPDGTRKETRLDEKRVNAIVEANNTDFEAEVTQENEQKIAQETAGAEMPTGKVPDATDTMLETLRTQALTNPDIASVLPMIEGIAQYKAEQDAEIERVRTEAETEMNNTDKDEDGVTDGVEEAAEEERKIIVERDAQQTAINLENKRISEETAKLAKDMAQLEKDKFEISQTRNENLQREANVEAEMKNRRVAAKLGINYDTNGLKWMATEIRKGTEALSYLIQSGDIQSSQFALSIGREYNLNMRGALNNYNSQQSQIDNQFREEMKAVRSMVSLDATERKKEKKALQTELFEKRAANDVRASNDLKWAFTTMQTAIKDNKESMAKKEDDALDRIDYLLKNYPRESVAEAIKELGQDVTSFDVQTLIDNPTLEEIKRAEAAMAKKRSFGGGGGGYSSSYLPSSMQDEPKPSITFQEYEQKKLTELEGKQNQSFSPEKRAKTLTENADAWQKEYDAIYTSGMKAVSVQQAQTDLVKQFGQPTVDAAQRIIDGTYGGTNPVKGAAAAFGVSEGAVATALTKLKQSGASSDSTILSTQQQTSRDKVIAQIKGDTFYTVWNGAKSAATRIQVAIGDSGGADGISDIMAINAFQNGIVDPGATVREGDVTLFQSAKAWSQMVNLQNWIQKISDGDKLPPEMRAKMLQLTLATRDAYGKDYQEQTVPKMKALIKQNGLPSSVLDEYLGTGGTTAPTISSEVQNFSDTYFSQ